jgi:MYXO-CTERM domain-containing protein
VITGSGGYFLHAFDGCGREPESWPKFTGQWMTGTPAVGDLDGDDRLEVAIGTRSGWLYVWHTKGNAKGNIPWESFHHDNRNTGNYDTPLSQGDNTRLAKEPMTDAFCEAALATGGPVVPLEPGGGCGACVIGDRDDGDGRGWLAAAWLAAAVAARRRRNASSRC